MEIKRPLMRYHGGKWKLADWIISNFPEHRVYVEPYGGAASVLLRKPRSYAEVYNDLDGEVVNLFRVYRDSGDELKRLIEATPFARDEFRMGYEPAPNPVEQARRTLVRSFMGFGSNGHSKNTGFRANSNRSGTTPAHDWMNYPDSMPAIIERLRGVVIENKDAMDVMLQHDGPDTLHYVDPPYFPDTRDAGADYRHEMTGSDHAALLDFVGSLEGSVVLSGYDCEMYKGVVGKWQTVSRKSLADGARVRTETLWIKGDKPQAGLF